MAFKIIMVILSAVCVCCSLICTIHFFIDGNIVAGIVYSVCTTIWNINCIIYTHWLLKEIEEKA